MDHLPPCCASCPELDGATRACKLLSAPSLENRHRLLTMPCDVPRLVRQRFRGHGENVGGKAMLSWLDPQRDQHDIVSSYGNAPRDARLWITSWPYRALGRDAIYKKLERLEPVTPLDAPHSRPSVEPDPVVFARVAAALARLSAIDPAGYGMTIDSLRGSFHTASWRSALGAADPAVEDRRILALYRYAVVFFEVLDRIVPIAARQALKARRFTIDEPGDAAALLVTREALGDKNLPITDWRVHYRDGVGASLDALRSEDAIGPGGVSASEGAIRRVLRVDDKPAPTRFDAAMFLLPLVGHAAAAGNTSADAHLDADQVAALASGELSAPDVATASRHLLSCRDERCGALLRWEVGGKEAVRRDLSGPMSEPPPGLAMTFTHGPASPHLVYCRDVLWDAFAQMARLEGRSVDDLVNDAMARYRVVREYAQPEEKKAPRPPAVPPRPSMRGATERPLEARGLEARPSEGRVPSERPSRLSSAPPPPPSRRRLSPPPPRLVDEITPSEGAIRRSSLPPDPALRAPTRVVTSPLGTPPASARGTALAGADDERDRAAAAFEANGFSAIASGPPTDPGSPPMPEWIVNDVVREPVTMRAPALQPPDASVVPTLAGLDPFVQAASSASGESPRPSESSASSGPSATIELAPATRPVPVMPSRTVELAPGLVPTTPRPAQSHPHVVDTMRALPNAESFSESEKTSPKMNLAPLDPPLFVEYQGARSHVGAARFVIGRERTTCNLVLADSNVSRQHAVVEWNAGQYFLLDLGSTNGVGCNGHRIHRKQIVEGDRFDICGHTITFSFRVG